MRLLRHCKFVDPEVFEDHRGVIKSFYPDNAIVEYNLMITKQGDQRGYHSIHISMNIC